MRQEIRQFLDTYRFSSIRHGNRTLVDHLDETSKIAENRSQDQDLIDACALHSIYGTEFFVPGQTISREAVRGVIGKSSEALVWVFCAMVRSSLQRNNSSVILRDGTVFGITPLQRDQLFLMIEFNSEELSVFKKGGRSITPASRTHGFFLDNTGIISQNTGRIDLDIMPKVNHPLVYRNLCASGSVITEAARVARGFHSSGQSHLSQVFSQEGSGLSHSRVRSSFNFPTGSGFEELFMIMGREVEKSLSGFDGIQKEPTLAGEQGLYYREGGMFIAHSDNTVRLNGILTTNTPDRQMVSILYLTEGVDSPEEVDSEDKFSGGELYFTKIRTPSSRRLSFLPKAGEIAIFPANLWYEHGVTSVTGGVRIALSRWWKVRN